MIKRTVRTVRECSGGGLRSVSAWYETMYENSDLTRPMKHSFDLSTKEKGEVNHHEKTDEQKAE